MTLLEISRINSSLCRANKITGLTFKNIRNITRLSNLIQPEIIFLNEQEIKILQEFCDKDSDGNPILENGEVKISNKSTKALARNKLSELRCTKVDLSYDLFEISESELEGNLPISPEDVKNLSLFIKFGDDQDAKE